mmetsp:Transcript_23369/g.51294  ORF Transcript_23369/g.51294 Transcript_23369/m.51294 type:complete len:460 (+) Transcript_23369:175-1554(+)
MEAASPNNSLHDDVDNDDPTTSEGSISSASSSQHTENGVDRDEREGTSGRTAARPAAGSRGASAGFVAFQSRLLATGPATRAAELFNKSEGKQSESGTDTDEEGQLIKKAAAAVMQKVENEARQNLGGGPGKGGAKRAGGVVSLKILIEAGILEPGEGVLYVEYKNNVTWGDLMADGQIHYQGMFFDSPSAFSIYLKRQVNPTRKADDGWKAVKYSGRLLEAYKDQYLRQKIDSSAAGGGDDTEPAASPSLQAMASGPEPDGADVEQGSEEDGQGPPHKRQRTVDYPVMRNPMGYPPGGGSFPGPGVPSDHPGLQPILHAHMLEQGNEHGLLPMLHRQQPASTSTWHDPPHGDQGVLRVVQEPLLHGRFHNQQQQLSHTSVGKAENLATEDQLLAHYGAMAASTGLEHLPLQAAGAAASGPAGLKVKFKLGGKGVASDAQPGSYMGSPQPAPAAPVGWS